MSRRRIIEMRSSRCCGGHQRDDVVRRHQATASTVLGQAERAVGGFDQRGRARRSLGARKPAEAGADDTGRRIHPVDDAGIAQRSADAFADRLAVGAIGVGQAQQASTTNISTHPGRRLLTPSLCATRCIPRDSPDHRKVPHTSSIPAISWCIAADAAWCRTSTAAGDRITAQAVAPFGSPAAADRPASYRTKRPRTLSHSDGSGSSCRCNAWTLPARGVDGCDALTGSDAGNVSCRAPSSLVSRSRRAASRESSACLSCGAGSNLSADFSGMTDLSLSPHWRRITPPAKACSPSADRRHRAPFHRHAMSQVAVIALARSTSQCIRTDISFPDLAEHLAWTIR
jgi:hypothetical protein